MEASILKKVENFLQEQAKHNKWKKVMVVLAAAVIIITAYGLSQPASTQEKNWVCGLEEHVHTAECYTLVSPGDVSGNDVSANNIVTEDGEVLPPCGKVEHVHSERCELTEEEWEQVDALNELVSGLPGPDEYDETRLAYLAGELDGDYYWDYIDNLNAGSMEAVDLYNKLSTKQRSHVKAENLAKIEWYSEISGTMLIAEVPKLNDLSEFLTGVDIKQGKTEVEKDENGVPQLYIGENYQITFSFAESPTKRQFSPDGDLIYKLPDFFDVKSFDGVPKTLTVDKDGKKVEVSYRYMVDKEGYLHIQFDDDEYSVDDFTLIELGITLDGTIVEANSGDVKIPLGDGAELQLNLRDTHKPTVEKKALRYNHSEKTVEYQVEIKAEDGPAKNLKIHDELDEGKDSELQYTVPFTYTYTVYDEEGNLLESKSVTLNDLPNTYEFQIDGLPSLEKGQRMVVEYKAHVVEAEYENGEIDNYESNTVTVTGGDEKDPFTVTDDASITMKFKVVEKSGETVNVDGQDMFKWTVELGDGTDAILGMKVTDEFGEGLSLYKEGTASGGIVVRVKNPETGEYLEGSYPIGWNSVTELSASEAKYGGIEYNLPTMADLERVFGQGKVTEPFVLEVEYYTTYDIPEGESAHVFSNTVKTTIGDNTYTDTGSVSGIGPVGDATKEIMNKDQVLKDGYIQYRVTVPDIPFYDSGVTPFRFEDSIYIANANGGNKGYVANFPQNLNVTLSGKTKETVTLKPYPEGALQENCYRVRTSQNHDSTNVNRFLLVFNTEDVGAYFGTYSDSSRLYIDEPSTMVVEYTIPLDAVVYADKAGTEELGTLRDFLLKGKILTNEATASFSDTVEKKANVDYVNPQYEGETVKTAKVLDDGIIEYRVLFKNWDTNIPIQDLHSNSPSLIQKPSGTLKFYDDFDQEYLEYVPGSLYVEAGTKNYYVKDAHDEVLGQYAIRDESALTSVYSQNEGRTSLVDEVNGTLQAYAGDFNKRIDPKTSSSFKDRWGSGNGLDDMTAKNNVSFEQALDKDEHLKEAKAIVFVYQLRVKDGAFKDAMGSYQKLLNKATIFDGSNPYSSECDVDYKTGMMDKTAERVKDELGNETDTILFTITMNPNKKRLITEDLATEQTTLTLIDEMSSNLALRVSSLKVMATGVDGETNDITEEVGLTLDESTNQMILSGLPDESYIVITYEADIIGELDEKANVSNKVWLDDLEGITSEWDNLFKVSGSTAEGSASQGGLTLFKQDIDTKKGLQGAVFLLYGLSDVGLDKEGEIPKEYVEAGYHEMMTFGGQTGHYLDCITVGENGRVRISNRYFTKETMSFVLVEVAAPTGYILPEGEASRTTFTFVYNHEDIGIEGNVVNNDGALTVYNSQVRIMLPNTGGPGTTLYTIAGASLVLAACFLYRRKLRERRSKAS